MALEPITRAEQIMSGESLEPITREEMFLAKAAGMDVDTPEPITRREMFLSMIQPGGGSGLPAGSSPNQYLVTDGEGNAKWEDKLCWNEIDRETEFVSDFHVEFEAAGAPVANPFICDIIEGETYVVTWDGVEYECVAYWIEGPNVLSIGNGAHGGLSGGNGEPFLMAIAGDNFLVFASEAGTHMVTVVGASESIHTIDKKYIPNPVNEPHAVIQCFENGTCKLTVSRKDGLFAPESALESGKDVVLIYDPDMCVCKMVSTWCDGYGNFTLAFIHANSGGLIKFVWNSNSGELSEIELPVG